MDISAKSVEMVSSDAAGREVQPSIVPNSTLIIQDEKRLLTADYQVKLVGVLIRMHHHVLRLLPQISYPLWLQLQSSGILSIVVSLPVYVVVCEGLDALVAVALQFKVRVSNH